MKIKTILIDDENKALAILENKLERLCPTIEIIAKTQNPKKAIEIIKTHKPQLVFLDISMPEINGFELLKHFQTPDFEIIFATAFDNYAIEAINHCAIGYLVKPVDNDDLIITVNKAIQNIEEKTALEKNKLLIDNLGVQKFQNKKIVIPSLDGLDFVKITDIIHCEGVEGYTRIHINNKKPILSSHSVGYFNKLLENQSFYLIHKSHLINLNTIEKYLNEGSVILTNKTKIPVSRNRRQGFLNSLKK